MKKFDVTIIGDAGTEHLVLTSTNIWGVMSQVRHKRDMGELSSLGDIGEISVREHIAWNIKTVESS